MNAHELDDRVCVLVVYANGDRIWEDAGEYRRNPAAGSYILHDQKKSGYKPPPIERVEPAVESGIEIRFRRGKATIHPYEPPGPSMIIQGGL